MHRLLWIVQLYSTPFTLCSRSWWWSYERSAWRWRHARSLTQRHLSARRSTNL